MIEPAPFDDAFRRRLHDLFAWRRDVRRFRPEPLPAGTLDRLIEVAYLSPSVGLSQPWRFVVVDDAGRRKAVLEEFKRCNADALKSYSGALSDRYAELKLAGLQEAPCQFAVFADCATEVGHGLAPAEPGPQRGVGGGGSGELLRVAAVLPVRVRVAGGPAPRLAALGAGQFPVPPGDRGPAGARPGSPS